MNKMLGRIGNLVPPTILVMNFGAIQLLSDFQDLDDAAAFLCMLEDVPATMSMGENTINSTPNSI